MENDFSLASLYAQLVTGEHENEGTPNADGTFTHTFTATQGTGAVTYADLVQILQRLIPDHEEPFCLVSPERATQMYYLSQTSKYAPPRRKIRHVVMRKIVARRQHDRRRMRRRLRAIKGSDGGQAW